MSDISVKISAAMQRSQVPPLLRSVNTRTVMLGLKMDINLRACHNSAFATALHDGYAQAHGLVIVGIL